MQIILYGDFMQIILYKTSDSENTINKTLSEALSLNVVFKLTFDIEAPTIILNKIEGFNYSDYNYLHIPDIGRYYFIRSESKMNFFLTSLECETDYLESFKSSILNATGSFYKPLEVGDYGELELSENGKKQVVYVESDSELTAEPDKVLTVLRWS